MSNTPEKLWTDEEKNFLLLEILKKAGISSTMYLLGIIRENRIDPQWMEMALPPGRSVHSCQAAFYRMDAEYPQPQHQPSFAGPIAPLQTSPGSRKRPLAPVPSSQVSPVPRAIQPKPPTATGHFQVPETRAPVPIPRISDPTSGERPRKRGRPSKLEIQRRQAAQGMVDPYRPSAPHPQPTPATTQPSPMATAPGSVPPLSAPTPQQHTPEQITRPQQQPAPLQQQTHGTEARRSSAPGVDVGTVPPITTTTSSVASKESTPRTILDDRAPSFSVPLGPSLGPAFKMVNPPASDSGGPEGATSNVSVTGAVVGGTQPVPGTEGAKND